MIDDVLRTAAQDIDPLDASIILAHVLARPREYVITHGDELVSRVNRFRFARLVKKRARGVPIAYLTGHKEFFGLDFFVNAATLIPRPDTEALVEAALREMRRQKNKRLVLIDVGTGTGCIPISILKNLHETVSMVIAIDISRSALRVAKRNARRHDAKITFLNGNLLRPLLQKLPFPPKNSTAFITANLPYLTQEQFAAEPSIQHEPERALVAENRGLALYETLITQLQEIVKKNHFALNCFFEIDPSQSARITAAIQAAFPHASIEIKTDLANRDRVVACIL